MNTNAREKIFKSWNGINEVALIKECATKGENIKLCMEYWARKRKISIEEYESFFQGVVHSYVERLLKERLVCKAENVLRNVQRDVKCFYYQFACECKDAELEEMVLEHLRRKEPQSFEQDLLELQFHWELLEQLKTYPNILTKVFKPPKGPAITLEALVKLDATPKQRLMTELYFTNRNGLLLDYLDKFIVWEFLVETQRSEELINWSCIYIMSCKDNKGNLTYKAQNELELKYSKWSIEPDMLETALKTLKDPSEVLRNCFAILGHIFPYERQTVQTTLRRICTTESFSGNQAVLEKLPIGRFLLQRGYYELMLEEFVSARELEELSAEYPEQRHLLQFIVVLKSNDIEKRAGFEKIAQSAKTYLDSCGVDFENVQPLVTFHEFLNNEPTIANLKCFLRSSALQHIPYLKSLSQRVEFSSSNSTLSHNMPTAYELLRKFKKFDFKETHKNKLQVASFSNPHYCQRYARKYHLNFLHYLKQQRSAYAVYFLLTEHLQNYAQITRAHLFSACEMATDMAIRRAGNPELVAHCVAFSEMLGFDTQNMRSFIKLCQLVGMDCVPSYSLLIERVEAHLLAHLKDKTESDFPLADFEALMRIVACHQQRRWPEFILKHYARDNDWWRLLILLQYFEAPLSQVKQIIEHFESYTMGEHLFRSLSYDATPTERNPRRSISYKRQHPQSRKTENSTITTSLETMQSSMSSCNDANILIKSTANQQLRFLPDSTCNLDLFAIILLSSTSLPEERIPNTARFVEMMQDNHSYCTSWNLMKNCVKFRLPILSLLAATVNVTNMPWNWLVWLAVAAEQWDALLSMISQNGQEFSWLLIEKLLRLGYTATLQRSFAIFHAKNPFLHLFTFMNRTQNFKDFSDDTINELRLYLLAWSNEEVKLPLCESMKRDQVILRSIKLLLAHLEENFHSALEQQKLLSCICASDISDICGLVDFCLLNKVFAIMENIPNWSIRFPINFEKLLQRDSKEYEQLKVALLEAKEYDAAVQLATLLLLPVCDIVYAKWVDGLDASDQVQQFEQYEREIATNSLPPEVLVNFYLYAASRLENACTRKYQLLQRALNVIKQHHLFPNESFDRDQIEYDMIICYLQIENEAELEQLDIYHSEYFEQIMLKERCVLYKSFLELKELAGIEELSTSLKTEFTPEMRKRLEALLNRLLDEGDIVEALRLQELFECRPIDLRFVVFCMALAEGVTTIFSMSPEERQLLRDVEKSSFAKFNKRTLGMVSASGGQRGQSPSKNMDDFSDSCSTLEFEEIPSKEKRETLDTIQGIASKLKYGVDIGKRVVLAYRAAMYLDKEYLDILRTKDVTVLLKSAAEEGCMHLLLVVSDILISTRMTPEEIAEMLAFEITTAVIRPRFYIFSNDQQAKNTFKKADLWGYDIDRDLHLLFELTPNTTKLGNNLLEYCDALKSYRKYQDKKPYDHNEKFEKIFDIIKRYGRPAPTTPQGTLVVPPTIIPSGTGPPQVLSHKKQNFISVELLIKAHQCFVHECSMEGIANVLSRAKNLNTILTNAKSWSLIVRMLTGIGHYREMFYCFDSLIANEQFESLLTQFDKSKATALRQAILFYLREYSPENGRELLKLAALHFLMYKELAEMWKQDAQTLLSRILATAQVNSAQLPGQPSMISLTSAAVVMATIPKLRTSPDVISLLQQALEYYTHSTENYLLDNKLMQAQKSASSAELVAMQIDLANKALEKGSPPQFCTCVINVQSREDFRELINSELSVPQALILSRAYGFDINWAEVLLAQLVILKRQDYLTDYLAYLPISDSIIENIVKGYQLYAQHHKPSLQMEENLAQLVELVKSVTLKYKLASLLSLKPIVLALLNDECVHYLRDTNFGRNESQDMPDI